MTDLRKHPRYFGKVDLFGEGLAKTLVGQKKEAGKKKKNKQKSEAD